MGVKPIHAACYCMTSASLPEAPMKLGPAIRGRTGVSAFGAPRALFNWTMAGWYGYVNSHKHLAGRSGVEPETSAFRAQRAARLRQRPGRESKNRTWVIWVKARRPNHSAKQWAAILPSSGLRLRLRNGLRGTRHWLCRGTPSQAVR